MFAIDPQLSDFRAELIASGSVRIYIRGRVSPINSIVVSIRFDSLKMNVVELPVQQNVISYSGLT
jgi:hypothetical protein